MKKKKIKVNRSALVMIGIIVAACLWIDWGNSSIMISKYTISSERIPDSFSGFRIVQVSDLHNAEFGRENKTLIKKIKELEPDIIVITGDLVDSYHPDVDVSISFAREAAKIAPTYYVSGNHEARMTSFSEFALELEEAGVIVLNNEAIVLEQGGDTITLVGVCDPAMPFDGIYDGEAAVVNRRVSSLMENVEGYSILLSHRPELFDTYVSNEVDLIFTGHAHGGQFRLPFVGGLFAPNQGWFPMYDAGIFLEGDTRMVVSRGLGNSAFPFRINNRPELVVAELKCEK